MSESGPVLKDLYALIRNSTIHYNDTCNQKDVVLTDDFKDRYGKYLRDNNYLVDFYRYTAVITTSANGYIFAPNQWFVIAAYGVGVYLELKKYKDYLLQVCKYMGQNPKSFIRTLRDNPQNINHNQFVDGCNYVFEAFKTEQRSIATERLWKFATDYSWWSGSKTIDRTDFHFSVILNMLSLVAVSQTFVADIVSDYYYADMIDMVGDLSNFTENETGATYPFEGYSNPEADIRPKTPVLVVENSNTASETEDEIVISVRSKK